VKRLFAEKPATFVRGSPWVRSPRPTPCWTSGGSIKPSSLR